MRWWYPYLLLWMSLGGGGPISAAVAARDVRVVVSGAERYVPLNELAVAYGYTVQIPPGRHIYLRNKWSSLAFTTDSREANINNIMVWLHLPLTKVHGAWAVTETDMRKVIAPLLRPYAYLNLRGYRTVLLDPGHGGTDRGARGPRLGIEEKRTVLDITRRVRFCLAREGVRVFLTRDGDRPVELDSRAAQAARVGADALVSIHLNSAESSFPRGVETYVMPVAGYPSTSSPVRGPGDRKFTPANNFDHSSTILGYAIQKALLAKTGAPDRGLRRARFVVIKNAACPAALVECGFLSNRAEEQALFSEAYRDKIARGIAQGILNYFNEVKRAKLTQ